MAPRTRRKTTRLEARITDSQKALLQEAATVRGQTLTEFVVRASEEAATRVLERAGVLVLSSRDSVAFVEALLHPPAPNAQLRAAAERYHAHRNAKRSAGGRTRGA
jgi:uncharacterized protein (DUF1778 family)